jgi:hypothetical protein
VSDSYIIPLSPLPMTAATTITIPQYNQKDAASIDCPYTEQLSFKIGGNPDNLSSYASWLKVSGHTVTLEVADADRSTLMSQTVEITVVNTLTNASPTIVTNEEFIF